MSKRLHADLWADMTPLPSTGLRQARVDPFHMSGPLSKRMAGVDRQWDKGLDSFSSRRIVPPARVDTSLSMLGDGLHIISIDDLVTAGIVALLAQQRKIPGVFRIAIRPQEAVAFAVFFLAASAVSHVAIGLLGLDNAKIRLPSLGF